MKEKSHSNYKNILRRARTYSTLLFYNKKYVDPYFLAAYAFQNSNSTKDL